MRKLSIIQSGVIAIVLALGVIAGVPRLSLAQPAEPTTTSTTADAQGQQPSSESERVQPAAERNEGGLGAATIVEIQRHFNELRSELLDDRSDSINWWLNVVLIVLGFMAVVIPIVGVVSWRVARAQFRQIETEARENADEIRRLLEQTQEHSAKVKSLSDGLTAESAGKEPDQVRQAAESVQENPTASSIHRAIAVAVLLQQEGKIDEAIEKWRSIANITEESDKELGARAWFSVGYLSNKRKDHGAAIDAYTQALHLNPSYAEAYSNRGNAKDALGQHQAALADYDAALRLNPNFAAAYYNRGNAERALGQYQAALTDYDKALRLNPSDAEAYINRGNAKDALGQHQAALADYDAALRLNPNFATAYKNRGNAKHALGQHQAALADYDAALRLTPNDAGVYYNRGNAKHALGQHQAALADYDVALRLNPNFAAAYFIRALVNLLLRQVEEARQDFEKALALAQEAGDEALATKARDGLQDLDKSKDS